MELAAEFWWVPPLAVFVATMFAAYRGYRRAPPPAAHSTIHGSAVVDSSVGREATVELRRIAAASEAIQSQLERTAKTEDLRAVIAAELRDELARQRRGGGA